MKSRKGQSALEYLMTYGWAVIAILVVIGLLYWLTSQQASSQAQCGTGFPNLPITSNSITTTGLQVELTNGTGKSLTNVIVSGKFTEGATVQFAKSSSASIAQGAKANFTVNPANALTAGDVTIDLNVSYNDGTFSQVGTSKCTARI